MSDSKTNINTGYGPGLFTLLGVLFIALKLTGVIDWSWWWVLAPLWGPMALGLAFLAVLGVVLLVLKLRKRGK